MQISVITLKQGILLFWTLWFAIVVLANIGDLLKRLHVLGDGWKFASGNYALMKKTTAIYHVPDGIILLLFIAVIIWETITTVLMASAALTIASADLNGVYTAFAFSLGLWAAFMLADEFFIDYETGHTHLVIFIAQVVSLLAICLLPAA